MPLKQKWELTSPLLMYLSSSSPFLAACQCSMFFYYGNCPHTDKKWVQSEAGEEKNGQASSNDPHWSTNALQHQAKIEQKVGRAYFKA